MTEPTKEALWDSFTERPDDDKVIITKEEFDSCLDAYAMQRVAEAVHPWYGPCDALAPSEQCAECVKVLSAFGISQGAAKIAAVNAAWNATPSDAEVKGRREEQARLEDPPEAVIARGVQMLNTPRSGPDETLVHDIWQAMLDEIRALAEPRR